MRLSWNILTEPPALVYNVNDYAKKQTGIHESLRKQILASPVEMAANAATCKGSTYHFTSRGHCDEAPETNYEI